MRVFVQGASRGIGLALTRHLLPRDEVEIVFASSRNPGTAAGLIELNSASGGRLSLVELDVIDEQRYRSCGPMVSNANGGSSR